MCAHTYVHIFIHTADYYSAIKKNTIVPSVTTWMNLEAVMLSELSQAEKD